MGHYITIYRLQHNQTVQPESISADFHKQRQLQLCQKSSSEIWVPILKYGILPTDESSKR